MRIITLSCLCIVLYGGFAQAAQPATNPQRTVSDQEFDAVLKAANDADENAGDTVKPLLAVASRFQSVDVCTAPERNMWSFRTLNERGKGIDAIRFTVPIGTKTHFYWAFSVPNLKSWYISPVAGKMEKGFEDWNSGEKYRLPGVINDHLILQHSPTRLTAGQDYILWFKFTNDKPVQLYASIVLLDDDRKGTVDDIVAAIGMRHQSGK